jgi:hypothetical protein
MKKKRWDHQKAIRQQWDQAINGILKMTGGGMKQKSDGSTTFCFGNCTMSGKGVYSSFTRYLVKKLKELVMIYILEMNSILHKCFLNLEKELLKLEMTRLESSTVPASKSIYIEILWQQRTWQIF